MDYEITLEDNNANELICEKIDPGDKNTPPTEQESINPTENLLINPVKRPLSTNQSVTSEPTYTTTSKKLKPENQQIPPGIQSAIREFSASKINIHKIPGVDLEEYITELLMAKSTSTDVNNYSQDKEIFLDTLELLRSHNKHKGIKNRLTRNLKHHRPNKQLENEPDLTTKMYSSQDEIIG